MGTESIERESSEGERESSGGEEGEKKNSEGKKEKVVRREREIGAIRSDGQKQRE